MRLTPAPVPVPKYVVLLTCFAVCAALLPMTAAASQNIQMSWDPSPSPDVVNYTVYYGSASGAYSMAIPAGNNTELVIQGLSDGVTYYFAVTAADSLGVESELSNEVSYTVPGIASPDITAIAQSASGQGAVLTWNASPSADVAGYTIHYWAEDGSSSGDISESDTTGTVEGLQQNIRYYFTVTAYDWSGNQSAPSPEISFVIATIEPPGPITSFQETDSGIAVTWTPSPSGNVAGYHVYYSPYSGYYYWEVSVENTNQAIIYDLANDSTYYFIVKAVDFAGNESAPSDEAIFTVPPLQPPVGITSIQQSGQDVSLTWDPSPSANVIGYYVYYGTDSGYYTGITWVWGTTQAVITGLEPGTTYYFSVLAVDSYWQASDFSPEASFEVAVVGPTLAIQPLPTSDFGTALSITSSDAMPASWTIEASSDLQNWRALITGTDPSLNVTVLVSKKPKLFFRLNSWWSDVTLETQTANGFPGSFAIASTDMVYWTWSIEASEDLQNWESFAGGSDSHVNVAVVTADTPALFFRLKSE
jgi:fibronectin type 3 domain-containing protein